MDELYPITIIKDRYSGTYSGAKWLAFNDYEENVGILPIHGSDVNCQEFWSRHANNYYPIGKGLTPNDALADLYLHSRNQ